MNSLRRIPRASLAVKAASLLVCVFAVRCAYGQEYAVDPSIRGTSAVNDNFIFQAQPHPTVLVLSLTPSLSLSRNTEDSSFRMDAYATHYDVPEQHSDDHTDLHLAFSYSLKDETDQYSLATLLDRQLTVEGEDISTGLLLEPQRRSDLNAAPTWTHFFTERLQGSVGLTLDHVSYSGATQSTSIFNYHYYTLPLTASYQISESDTLTAAYSASQYRADEVDERIESEELQFGYQHAFNENAHFAISLGGFESRTHTSQTFTVCPLSAVFCQLGLVPFVTLRASQAFVQGGSLLDTTFSDQFTERDSFTLHGTRTLAPSGAGTLLLVTSYDGSLQRNFDENLVGTITFARAQNRYVGLSGSPLTGIETIQAKLSRKLDEHALIEFGIRHTDTFSALDTPRVRANEVYASYQYQWPQSSAAQSH